jgi:predicted nucleotidyltransferase
MRLNKNSTVCGLPAHHAREIMRLFNSAKPQRFLQQWADDADALATAFADEGWFQFKFRDAEGDAGWETTTRGNALAQASFRRAITRRTAERHLKAVVQRASDYNEDPGYLFSIEQVIVFGSYLQPDVAELGDLDIAITTRDRNETPERAQRALEYAAASGRSFGAFVDRLSWAETELTQILRNRTSSISVTREDVSTLTDQWQVVYSREDR